MTEPQHHPSPRDGLDDGTATDLLDDAGEVRMPHTEATPWSSVHVDLEVPDDASRLLEGLGDYGS
jgi:hypothetical protein